MSTVVVQSYDAGSVVIQAYDAGTLVETQATTVAPVLPTFVENAWEGFRLTGVGSPVVSIPDSVASVDLIQATAGSRGVLRNDGFHNYIEMDSTDDEYHTAANVNWTAGFTWVVVGGTDSLFNYRNFAGLGASGASTKSLLFSSGGGAVALQRRNPSLQNCTSANSVFAAGVNHVITADSGAAQVWLNRTSVATTAALTIPSADIFAVGRPYAILTGGRINGRIYAVYKCPPNLTLAQREELWDYLDAWLAGSL